MKKNVLLIAVALGIMGLGAYFLFGTKKENKKYTVGVIVPIEHQAMDAMVGGFCDTLKQTYGNSIKIDVQNAQGDLNLQKAIIQNFRRKHYMQIVSIGTDVTLMTMNVIKNQPILGLDVTDQVQQIQPNITGVLESPIEPSYLFLRELIRPLHKVAMVYSSSDKNYQMVKAFSELAKKDGIEVQPIMVQSLPDLYVLASRIDKDVEAIFIAKDHLVASGAALIAKAAEKQHVPLVTCDEGSVIAGGACALGNKERDIGQQGAVMVMGILEGVSPSELPIAPVSKYTLFINKEAAQRQGMDLKQLIQTADRLGYQVEVQ